MVGLVPTLGALHAGHLSLITAARRATDFVAVSVFVNPTQFNDASDLAAYPRDLAADVAAASDAGADLVFAPSTAEMYPDGPGYVSVDPGPLGEILEGASRPGHFRGVATVVTKLFGQFAPCRAYFGEKDFQQATIVRALARELMQPVEVVLCPTVRDLDGLALSSRNSRLSPDERRRAPLLYRSLLEGRRALRAKATPLEAEAVMASTVDDEPGFALDYAVVRGAATLGPRRQRSVAAPDRGPRRVGALDRQPRRRGGAPLRVRRGPDRRRTMTVMADSRTFELRTYVAAPGKLDALVARFRDHTMTLFTRHGIEVVGFFVDPDAETLVYINAFSSRAEADASWEAFRADPEWIAARAASEVDGPLTASLESRFLTATDFSALR